MSIKLGARRVRVKGPITVTIILSVHFILLTVFNMNLQENAVDLSSTEVSMSIYYQKIQDMRDKGYLSILQDVRKCDDETSPIESCVDASCDDIFPPVKVRVQKVLSSIRSRDQDTLISMMKWAEFQATPTQKRVLFLTAASSNHFYESLALIRHLKKRVFPTIENYTMVFYELGLTTQERLHVEKFCNCDVRRFPVEKMPEHLKSLTCYAWKPLIIQANIHRADILIYMDSSTRLGTGSFQELLEDVQVQGLVCKGGGNSMPQNIDFRMMDYFNTTPCLYSAYHMRQAGFLVLHNHVFVKKMIILPWAVCAVSQDCMCPVGSNISCDFTLRKYGKCHRYDQAALSLILVNLFGRYVASVSVRNMEVEFKRGDQYFKKIIV